MSIKLSLLSPLQKFEEAVIRIIRKHFPTIGKYDGSLFGRVDKVNLKGGDVGLNSKGVSLDIIILQKDFTPDPDFDIILDVPFDTKLFGNGGSVLNIPSTNSIVRLAFMYNDPSFPYIVSFTSEGRKLPTVTPDIYRVDTGDGAIWQIEGKKIRFKTDKFNTDIDTVLDEILSHGHLNQGLGAPTSSPAAGVPPLIAANFNTGGLK